MTTCRGFFGLAPGFVRVIAMLAGFAFPAADNSQALVIGTRVNHAALEAATRGTGELIRQHAWSQAASSPSGDEVAFSLDIFNGTPLVGGRGGLEEMASPRMSLRANSSC